MHAIPISRRQFLQANATATPHSKAISSSGEMLPVIGKT